MFHILTILPDTQSESAVAPRLVSSLDWSRLRAALAVILGAGVAGLAVVRGELWPVMGLVLAAVAVLWPIEISLGLFAATIPFASLFVWGEGGATLSWGLGAFAGALLLAYGLITSRFHTPPRPSLWWGAFALWTASSAAWAWDSAISRRWVPTVLSLFALYLVVTSFEMTGRDLTRLGQLIMLGGVVTACMLVYQSHTSGLQQRATLGLSERLANPNEVAESLLLPLGLSLGSMFAARTVGKRIMLAILAISITTGVFVTGSRGCLVALSVMLLYFLIHGGVRSRAVVLIPIMVIPLLFVPSMFYSRLKEAPTGRGTGRLDILMVGAKIVAEDPLIGVGLGNFSLAYDKHAGAAQVFRGFDRAPHDAYLQAWAETGIVGLALLLIALGSQLTAVHRATFSRHQDAAFAISMESSCWGLLVMALAGSTLWSKAFWLAFMLLALAVRQAQLPAGAGHELGMGVTRAGHPVR